jgi:hypothetical protein
VICYATLLYIPLKIQNKYPPLLHILFIFQKIALLLLSTQDSSKEIRQGDKPNIDDRGGAINTHFPLPFLRMSVICRFF